MPKLTRDVIADLWPLYVSGEASQDTRELVESFLREDPEYARTLRQAGSDVGAPMDIPALSPDHEVKTLALIRRRLAGPFWLLYLAMIFSGFAFARIVSDTSFDVSPRPFIVTATIAESFWIAFFIVLLRWRRQFLWSPRRRDR